MSERSDGSDRFTPGVYIEDTGVGPPPIVGVSTTTAGFVGPTERGPVEPRLVTSWADYVRWFGDIAPEPISFLPWAVRGFFDNGGRRAVVARITARGAETATLRLDGSTALTVSALGPGALDGRLFVRVAEPTQRDPADPIRPDPTRVRITVVCFREAQAVVEGFEAADAVEDYDDLIADEIEATLRTSALVSVRFEPGQPPSPPDLVPFTALTGGADAEPLAAADYVGDAQAPSDERTGLAGLETFDDISLLCVPDDVTLPEVQAEVVAQCERRGDRFAILQVAAGREPTAVHPSLESSYGALYYPWVRVAGTGGATTRLVPPGGHVAGIIAASDLTRGVARAPVNLEVRGITSGDSLAGELPLERDVTAAETAALAANGVNVLRDFRFAGRGVLLWGARTLSGSDEWRYVNVRRLFVFLERSIDRGLQWVVFEPNEEATWQRVRRAVEDFLDGQWRAGAFEGATPDKAYFVRCDRSTMTQADLDAGRLIVLLGVAPLRPAEFVMVRIGLWTARGDC